jgi:hypothetical protein
MTSDAQVEAACRAYHSAAAWSQMPEDRIVQRASPTGRRWDTTRDAERQVMRAALNAAETAAWRPIGEEYDDAPIRMFIQRIGTRWAVGETRFGDSDTEYIRADVAAAAALTIQTNATAEITRLRTLLRRALDGDAEWREDAGEYLHG